MAFCASLTAVPIRQAIGETNKPSSSSTNHSAQNKPDKNGDSLTPTKHSEATSHIDLVARIRREINKDDALSITARYIKIITINRRVMLRGPVPTEQEKLEIEARAAAIAGSTNVDDQLEVAAQ